MSDAGLMPENNRWDMVFDFNVEDKEGNKLENFTMLDPSSFSIVNLEVEGETIAPSQIAVPMRYGGTLPDNEIAVKADSGLQEFDIHTSAADAQKQYEES